MMSPLPLSFCHIFFALKLSQREGHLLKLPQFNVLYFQDFCSSFHLLIAFAIDFHQWTYSYKSLFETGNVEYMNYTQNTVIKLYKVKAYIYTVDAWGERHWIL